MCTLVNATRDPRLWPTQPPTPPQILHPLGRVCTQIQRNQSPYDLAKVKGQADVKLYLKKARASNPGMKRATSDAAEALKKASKFWSRQKPRKGRQQPGAQDFEGSCPPTPSTVPSKPDDNASVGSSFAGGGIPPSITDTIEDSQDDD